MACFLDCLGTLKVELPFIREHDSHAVALLFSGLISSPDFAADFLEAFRIFKLVGVPFGKPFGCPCPFKLGQTQTKMVNKYVY